MIFGILLFLPLNPLNIMEHVLLYLYQSPNLCQPCLKNIINISQPLLFEKKKCWYVLTLSLYRLFNKRNLKGGQICPPLLYDYLRTFSILFFNRGLVMDVKGQNPKAEPSTIKIVALRYYWKIINFGKKPKKLKSRYLEILLFIHKRPVKIKPRHIGCSVFL